MNTTAEQPPGPSDLPRRVRAARALAGVSIEELTQRIAVDGLGARTLRKIESGERPGRPMEIREIARACGVPYAFFYLDFELLQAIEDTWPAPDQLERLGLSDQPQADVVKLALQLLQEQVRDERIADLPGGLNLVARLSGQTTTDDLAAIRTALGPVLQEVSDNLARMFQERIDALEDEVVSLRRQSGRDELERELEEAAQQREQQRDSSAPGRPSPRHQVREQ